MSELTQATAGDTWSWTRSGAGTDYPASAGWTLTYYLSIGAETPHTVAATASGDDYAASVAASESAGWAPGEYRWTARLEKAGVKVTIGTGLLRVLPDPTIAHDRRTHAEKALAAVTAALEGRMGDSIVEYEIDGVKAKKIPHVELVRLRDKYRIEVSLQRGRPVLSRIPVGGLR